MLQNRLLTPLWLGSGPTSFPSLISPLTAFVWSSLYEMLSLASVGPISEICQFEICVITSTIESSRENYRALLNFPTTLLLLPEEHCWFPNKVFLVHIFRETGISLPTKLQQLGVVSKTSISLGGRNTLMVSRERPSALQNSVIRCALLVIPKSRSSLRRTTGTIAPTKIATSERIKHVKPVRYFRQLRG